MVFRWVVAGGVVLLVAGPVAGWAQDAPPAPPPSGQHYPGGPAARFRAANVTHDGRLTMEQAQQAGWTQLARHFDQIDVDHKGYVTMQDLRAFHQRMKAQRAAEQGAPPQGQPQGDPYGDPPQ